MVDFRDIIQKRKNKELYSTQDIDVNRLIETNSNLEEKIDRLYKMLGGDDSNLVKREKLCDEHFEKIADAIKKLEKAKKEINEMIKETHLKLQQSEKNEQQLQTKIDFLTAENYKLKNELQKANEFSNKLLRTTPEDMVQYNEKSFTRDPDSFTMNKNNQISNDNETRLNNIEQTILLLASRLDKIQNSLDKLTDPISPSIFNISNPYEITEKFLDS